MNARLLAAVAAAIGEASGREFTPASSEPCGGGCIHQGLGLSGRDGARYFVKWNAAHCLEMFQAEADGLHELAAADALRVPRPLTAGSSGDAAFLVLEWLPLGGRGDPAELGRRLADLHRHVRPEFGWRRDNHIGATPQHNAPMADWPAFFRDRRLGFQWELARDKGAPRALLSAVDKVRERIADFFHGHRPVASLLHGDLWSGNQGYAEGEPVLFDPAPYYGDREADLAMSELFGGFPPAFYAAYREAWPLDAGYERRRHLYNLYHLLNHYNLFGGAYAGEATRTAEQLLAGLH